MGEKGKCVEQMVRLLGRFARFSIAVQIAYTEKRGESMKRNTGIVLCILMVMLFLPIAARGADYISAPPSENTEVYPQNLGNGTYDLLLNGDFETVGENSVASGWDFSHDILAENASVHTVQGDAKSGKNFVAVNGKTGGRIYVMQTLRSTLPGEKYTFTAYMRNVSGTAKPMLYIDCQKPTATSHTTIKTYYHTLTFGKDWTKVEYSFPVVSGTSRLIFRIRLDGEAEYHIDKASLVGKTTENVKVSVAFRDALRAEAQLKDKTEKAYVGKTDGSTAEGQPESILKNGSFEKWSGKIPTDWGRRADHAAFLSVAESASVDGSDCIRISVPKGNGLKHPYYYQIQDIVGGAEYELSFWYKTNGGNAAVKLEYYTDRTLPGSVSCGGKHFSGTIQDGKWHQFVTKIYPPENAEDVTVMPRLLQNSENIDAECMMDDVKIRMLNPPSPLTLDTDAVFYYTDETEGVLTASVNLQYFPDFSNTRVDFEILDGESVLWQKKMTSENGKAMSSFPLTLLSLRERPYMVKATLYNASGTVAEIKTQHIYKYERPAYLGEDGVYRKNGTEPFYPVYAYHVNQSHYQKVAEAGINLVQMGAFSNAEQALAALDKAQEAGIMGFIALYLNMKPAGNFDNIDTTISIVGDSRVQNHPALFGYGVMDEVFLALNSPQADLENSYRLLRQLDKKHPIMAMEAVSNYYRETGKYVDILCIDPYSSAEAQNASISTALAREAVAYKKPVYALLETYYNTHGRWPLPEDGRNNNWQALITGASAVGYYSISDADVGQNNESIPMWNARDNGKLWDALCLFGEKEKTLAYDHFVFDKTPVFNQFLGSTYWYHSWVKDDALYLIVLGLQENQEKSVTVPLVSLTGDIRVGSFSATCLAGGDTATVTGQDSLTLTVKGVGAYLYKITPHEKIDFSGLTISRYEDMENYTWAWQQAAKLDSLGILQGDTPWTFRPEESISGSEFSAALKKIIGVQITLPDRDITLEEATNGLQDALVRSDVFKNLYMEEKLCAQYAVADILSTLHRARLESDFSAQEVLTRAEAAVILNRTLYVKENPETVRAYAGMTKTEAEQMQKIMQNSIGALSQNTWYTTSENYVFLQNGSDFEREIIVPKNAAYIKILFGGKANDITQSETSLKVILPARETMVLKLSDAVMPGLYVGNCADAVPRENVLYTAHGTVGIYKETEHGKELLDLVMDGETVSLKSDVSVRAFLWNDTMQPID